jgi:SAM-dependent methyltransferase
MLARLPAGEEKVFLDYGCGLGRVLVAAAWRPYSSVLGVELLPEFADVARENVRRARGLRCRDVRVIESDAAAFDLPDCVTVPHFYNPFRGPVLNAVLRKVRESLDRSPRVIHDLYFNRDDFHRAAAGHPWIDAVEETSLSNPGVGCGLYKLRGQWRVLPPDPVNDRVLVHAAVVTEARRNHLVALVESDCEFGLTGPRIAHPLEIRACARFRSHYAALISGSGTTG